MQAKKIARVIRASSRRLPRCTSKIVSSEDREKTIPFSPSCISKRLFAPFSTSRKKMIDKEEERKAESQCRVVTELYKLIRVTQVLFVAI